MNVRELIEALSPLDPDLPVMMPSQLGADFATVDRLLFDVMSASDSGFELCDYEDEGCLTVVRMFEDGEYDDGEERPTPQ